jgi:hypothetical protein
MVNFDRRPTLFALMLLLITLSVPPVVNATAIATASVQLTALTITPSSGFIVVFPGHTQAYTRADNVLGQTASDNISSGLVLMSSVAITWANASVTADSLSQTSSATTNVNVHPLGSRGAANSVAEGFTSEDFVITGTSGPVDVQVNAIVPHQQLLLTDAGFLATSLVAFDLHLLNSIDIVHLEDRSSYSVGPNSIIDTSGIWNLGTEVELQAGKTYFVFAIVSAGSAVTPEPATLSLFLAGVLPPVILRRLRR